MGGTSTRAYSGARQTWVRKGQHFIEKLVFEGAQRVVPVPVLWMMNPYKVVWAEKNICQQWPFYCPGGGLLPGVQKTLLEARPGPDLGLTFSGCN